MARCNCGAQTCSCVLTAGDGVSITGSGTARDPWVVATEGGGGGESGWSSGDRKETYRSDTPAGWLEGNGQAVSRITYASLFGAIGTRYGAGDGVNTFNLPNETGRVSIGAGPGYPQDQTGGSAQTTLVTANLPPHTHSINHDHPAVNTTTNGSHDHNMVRITGTGGTSNFPRGASGDGALSSTGMANAGNHTHSVNLPNFIGTSGSTGSGASFTNLPPYRAIRVLVKT